MEPDPSALRSNPQDTLQGNIIACAVIRWAFGASFVCLRIYTRRFIINVIGLEDWLILCAAIVSTAFSANVIAQAALGLGRHVRDIPPENLMHLAKAGWVSSFFCPVALLITKLSTLVLYLRIFSHNIYQHLTCALIIVVAMTSLFSICVVATACIPLNAAWDPTVQGKCHPESFWFASFAMHAITDFLIVLLPVPVVFTLKAPTRQKIILGCIFTVAVVSAVRCYILISDPWTDLSYDIKRITWTCIEVNLAIVCPCAMTLKPLVSKCFPGLLSNHLTTQPTPAEHVPTERGAGHRNGSLSTRPKGSWLRMTDSRSVESLILEGQRFDSIALREISTKPLTNEASVSA